MDTVAFVAGMATVLSAFQLLPQLARSMRLRSTAGLSPIWAAIGVIVNLGWCWYRWSQELWLSLPSPVIAAGLYLALLWMVLRSTEHRRSALVAATGAAATIGVAGFVGGWTMAGTALGLSGGVQVTPAVWSAFRTRGPLAIAPGLWITGLGQALLWGYYGAAHGDTGLIIYGLAAGSGALTILAIFAFRHGKERRTGARVIRSAAPQPVKAV
jgi:uncharacterized protein with PQ loop repeat